MFPTWWNSCIIIRSLVFKELKPEMKDRRVERTIDVPMFLSSCEVIIKQTSIKGQVMARNSRVSPHGPPGPHINKAHSRPQSKDTVLIINPL